MKPAPPRKPAPPCEHGNPTGCTICERIAIIWADLCTHDDASTLDKCGCIRAAKDAEYKQRPGVTRALFGT